MGGAWWLRRRSSLSIRNLYPPAALGVVLVGGAVAVRWWPGVLALTAAVRAVGGGGRRGAAVAAADLGAGEELRNHELGRRWIWQPALTAIIASGSTCAGRANWSTNGPGRRACLRVDDRPRARRARGCRWGPGST